MHLIILRTSGSAAEDEAEGLQVGQKTSHLATRLPGTEIMKSQFKLDYLDLIDLIDLIGCLVLLPQSLALSQRCKRSRQPLRL